MDQKPTLTRRRLNERFESWGIFYGEVRVGRLSKGIGLGSSVIWQWSCGFYPGCTPHQQRAGNTDTFDEAKAAFHCAWETLQPQITPAMLTKWSEQQAFTRWKYAMIDAGHQMPTQTTTGKSHCFCGAEITMAGVPAHIVSEHA